MRSANEMGDGVPRSFQTKAAREPESRARPAAAAVPGELVAVRVRMTADGSGVAVNALRVRLYRQSMRDDLEGPERIELEGSPVRARVETPGLVVGVGETVEREVSLMVPEDAILPDVPSTRQLHRVEVVVEGGVEAVTVEGEVKVARPDNDDDDEPDDEVDQDEEDVEPPAMTPSTMTSASPIAVS